MGIMSHSCCPICYKAPDRNWAPGGESEQLRSVQNRFFLLFQRFLEEGGAGAPPQGSGDGMHIPLEQLMETGAVASCAQCFRLMNSFCQLYHELKELELQLIWKVGTLKEIMKGAQKVPARVKWLKECIEQVTHEPARGQSAVRHPHQHQKKSGATGAGVEKSVDWVKWKKSLIRKCSQKLKRTFPKLSIPKWRSGDDPRGVSRPEGSHPPQTFPKTKEVNNSDPDRSTVIIPVKGSVGYPHDYSGEPEGRDNVGATRDQVNVRSSPRVRRKRKRSTELDDGEAEVCSGSSVLPIPAKIIICQLPQHEGQPSPPGHNEEMDFEDHPATVEFSSSRSSSPPPVILPAPTPSLPGVKAEMKVAESGPATEISEGDGVTCEISSGRKLRQLRSRHPCHVCGKTFTSNDLLQSHEHEVHSNHDNDSDSDDDWAMVSPDEEEDDDFQPLTDPLSDSPSREDKPNLIEISTSATDEPPLTSSESGEEEEEVEMKLNANDDDIEKTTKRRRKPKPNIPMLGDHIRLKCPDCSQLFKDVKGILLHRKSSESCGASSYDPTQSIKVEVLAPPTPTASHTDEVDFTTVLALIDLPQQIFICDLCDLPLYSSVDMEEHKKLHGSFSCKFCSFRDSYAPNIATHELQHVKRKRRKKSKMLLNLRTCCPRCEFDCDRKCTELYIDHHLKSHLSLSFNQPDCPLCQTIPLKWGNYTLGRHFKLQHDLRHVKKDKSKGIERCPVGSCSAYFLNAAQLRQHLKYRHSQSLESVNFRFQCPDCQKLFRDVEGILTHRKETETCGGAYDPTKYVKVHVLVPPPDAVLNEKELEDEAKFTSVYATVDLPQMIFTCDLCGCPTYSEQDRESHAKLHGKFSCDFCSVEVDYAPDLPVHELNSHRKKKEVGNGKMTGCCCPRCDFDWSWGGSGHYIRHHLKEHLSLTFSKSICPICKSTAGRSVTKFTLQEHLKTFHDLSKVAIPEDIKRCTVGDCNSYFLSTTQLISHLYFHHNIGEHPSKHAIATKNKKRDKSLNDTVKLTTYEKRKLRKAGKLKQRCHKCKDCDKSFLEPRTLREHRIKHHVPPEQIIPCSFKGCPNQFESKMGLERHLKFCLYRSLEGPPQKVYVQCDQCGKSVDGTNRSYLQLHLKSHEYLAQLKCELCGKIFQNKNALDVHSLSHSGPESWAYLCSLCSKKCLTKQKLEEHMRTHTKDKPFVCQLCGQKYAHRHNLRIHVNNKHGDQIQDIARKKNDVQPNPINSEQRKAKLLKVREKLKVGKPMKSGAVMDS